MRRTPLLVASIGLALVVSGCSDSSDTATDATSTTRSTATAAAASEKQPPLDLTRFAALPPVPAGAGPVDCAYPAGGGGVREVTAPNSTGVSTDGTATVNLATSAGPIGLTLNRAAAPCTVNSFVSLAQQGFYDDTPCHRLVTEAGLEVLQCGDPSGKGNGGPGYTFANEYPTTAFDPADPAVASPAVYPRGTIAMANGGPDTNGSQFFLVYADSVLPPQYTVFGTISEEGLATIAKVAADGDDGSISAGGGAPNTPVQIEIATVG